MSRVVRVQLGEMPDPFAPVSELGRARITVGQVVEAFPLVAHDVWVLDWVHVPFEAADLVLRLPAVPEHDRIGAHCLECGVGARLHVDPSSAAIPEMRTRMEQAITEDVHRLGRREPRPLEAGPDPVVVLAEHQWAWDEGSGGFVYQYCRRCGRDREDVMPNEHHDMLGCTP